MKQNEVKQNFSQIVNDSSYDLLFYILSLSIAYLPTTHLLAITYISTAYHPLSSIYVSIIYIFSSVYSLAYSIIFIYQLSIV